MASTDNLIGSHSSVVHAHLAVNGQTFRVWQVGNGQIILRQPAEIPAGSSANLIISVDGQVDEKTVFLPHGSTSSTEVIAYY